MRTVPEKAIIASRYRILRELGRGGMGAVFLAEHLRTGDQVALKVLLGQAATDPHALERFKREARASARIKSEHVVKVVDADIAPELDGAPFIVMELLDGSDLDKILAARGHLPPAEVVSLLVQAARALDRSHAMGIIHRDLKPENLFLHRRQDGTEILKIVDFGISKVIDGDLPESARAGLTHSGTMVGTPFYMSPEQAKGQVSEIGPGTDVWAMGLIAIRLLTGETYWTSTSVAELMVEVLSAPMAPPTRRWASLPAGMDAWFATSCDRDVSRRFRSVGEQIAALADALGMPVEPSLTPQRSTPELRAPLPRASPLASSADSLASAPTVDAKSTPPEPRVSAPPGMRTPDPTATSASRAATPPVGKARTRGPWLAALAVGVVAIGGAAFFFASSVPSPSAESANGAATASTTSAALPVVPVAAAAPSESQLPLASAQVASVAPSAYIAIRRAPAPARDAAPPAASSAPAHPSAAASDIRGYAPKTL